jgi:rhamnosyltransferase
MTRPRIAVLLATHDGAAWLDEQLDSILGQRDVDVRVIVSDDASADATPDLLATRLSADPRITVLPPLPASGSAAANFARLFRDADVSGCDFVALSDQDDVWMADKLVRHAALLSDGDLDGISSEVTAVGPDGSRRLVRKAFPQRPYDWVCESPGPGSTFLLTPRLVSLVADVVRSGLAESVQFNDWLVYAVCRARGWRWHIDAAATVDYRQHDDNVMGANHGRQAALSRFRLITARWHREQALAVVDAALSVVPRENQLAVRKLRAELVGTGLAPRVALARQAWQLRRRPRDRALLAALLLAGIW